MALRPFTLKHFEAYTSHLVLDTGDYWRLEDFQGVVVDPILFALRERMAGKDSGGWEFWTVIPEGNAKTTLMAGLALYVCDYCPLPWIPLGASSRDQAEILAQQAYQMINNSPGMLQRFRIYEGYRRIQPIRRGHPNPGDRGIKVHAADVGTNDGVIPFPLGFCDELHRHSNLGLYRLWRGKCRKRGASMAAISTAGEPGSEFEQARDAIRDKATEREEHGAYLYVRAGKTVMHEWRVVDPVKIKDMREVKAANPLSTITVQTLREDFESPNMDLGNWRRLKCNVPARSMRAAVSDKEWSAALMGLQIPAGSHVELGLDVAWKHDTFAIVPLWQPDGEEWRLLGNAEILTPPRDGSLHPDEAKAAFDPFFDEFFVDTVVMDMTRAEELAAWLEDEKGVTVVDWPQGNAQAARDYEAFMAGLRNGWLKHSGHGGLTAHVMHAIARALPNDKRRFDRPSPSRASKKQDERVIDALVAAAMVNSYASTMADGVLAGEVEDYRIIVLD